MTYLRKIAVTAWPAALTSCLLGNRQGCTIGDPR
jgi:hypothetical protein